MVICYMYKELNSFLSVHITVNKTDPKGLGFDDFVPFFHITEMLPVI